jgi:hypothetical protein
LPADKAPLFVPVVTELRRDGTMAAESSRGTTAITIEIGGAVVRAAPGVEPRLASGRTAGREGGDMIAVPAGVKVLIAAKPVDFRKGGDGLAALVREALGEDPFSGTISSFGRSGRID